MINRKLEMAHGSQIANRPCDRHLPVLLALPSIPRKRCACEILAVASRGPILAAGGSCRIDVRLMTGERTMRASRNRWCISLAMAAAFGLPRIIAAADEPKAAGAGPAKLHESTVGRADTAATVHALGTVEPEEVVDVGSQVNGIVKSFGADPHVVGKSINFGSQVEEETPSLGIGQGGRHRQDPREAGGPLYRRCLSGQVLRGQSRADSPQCRREERRGDLYRRRGNRQRQREVAAVSHRQRAVRGPSDGAMTELGVLGDLRCLLFGPSAAPQSRPCRRSSAAVGSGGRAALGRP